MSKQFRFEAYITAYGVGFIMADSKEEAIRQLYKISKNELVSLMGDSLDYETLEEAHVYEVEQ